MSFSAAADPPLTLTDRQDANASAQRASVETFDLGKDLDPRRGRLIPALETLRIRVRDRRNHRALSILDDTKTSDVRDVLRFQQNFSAELLRVRSHRVHVINCNECTPVGRQLFGARRHGHDAAYGFPHRFDDRVSDARHRGF